MSKWQKFLVQEIIYKTMHGHGERYANYKSSNLWTNQNHQSPGTYPGKIGTSGSGHNITGSHYSTPNQAKGPSLILNEYTKRYHRNSSWSIVVRTKNGLLRLMRLPTQNLNVKWTNRSRIIISRPISFDLINSGLIYKKSKWFQMIRNYRKLFARIQPVQSLARL